MLEELIWHIVDVNEPARGGIPPALARTHLVTHSTENLLQPQLTTPSYPAGCWHRSLPWAQIPEHKLLLKGEARTGQPRAPALLPVLPAPPTTNSQAHTQLELHGLKPSKKHVLKHRKGRDHRENQPGSHFWEQIWVCPHTPSGDTLSFSFSSNSVEGMTVWSAIFFLWPQIYCKGVERIQTPHKWVFLTWLWDCFPNVYGGSSG